MIFVRVERERERERERDRQCFFPDMAQSCHHLIAFVRQILNITLARSDVTHPSLASFALLSSNNPLRPLPVITSLTSLPFLRGHLILPSYHCLSSRPLPPSLSHHPILPSHLCYPLPCLAGRVPIKEVVAGATHWHQNRAADCHSHGVRSLT